MFIVQSRIPSANVDVVLLLQCLGNLAIGFGSYWSRVEKIQVQRIRNVSSTVTKEYQSMDICCDKSAIYFTGVEVFGSYWGHENSNWIGARFGPTSLVLGHET